eukprot:gene1671-1956_t
MQASVTEREHPARDVQRALVARGPFAWDLGRTVDVVREEML